MQTAVCCSCSLDLISKFMKTKIEFWEFSWGERLYSAYVYVLLDPCGSASGGVVVVQWIPDGVEGENS